MNIAGLTAQQIRSVVQARRSLPIPATVHAGMVARQEILKSTDGHRLMNRATNDATQNCREAGITEAHAIITFQVCSEEYLMGEQTKEVISQDDYDTLTFAFRSVLDPVTVPEHLSQRLRNYQLPTEEKTSMPNKPAPKPTTAAKGRKPAGNRPNSAAGRKRATEAPTKAKRPAPTKPARVVVPRKVAKKQVDALQDFLDGKD